VHPDHLHLDDRGGVDHRRRCCGRSRRWAQAAGAGAVRPRAPTTCGSADRSRSTSWSMATFSRPG
jgi:hypothetical protein